MRLPWGAHKEPKPVETVAPKPVPPKPPKYRVVAWQETLDPEGWQARIEHHWYDNRYSDHGYLTKVKPTKDEVVKECQDEIDRLIRKAETHGVVA